MMSLVENMESCNSRKFNFFSLKAAADDVQCGKMSKSCEININVQHNNNPLKTA